MILSKFYIHDPSTDILDNLEGFFRNEKWLKEGNHFATRTEPMCLDLYHHFLLSHVSRYHNKVIFRYIELTSHDSKGSVLRTGSSASLKDVFSQGSLRCTSSPAYTRQESSASLQSDSSSSRIDRKDSISSDVDICIADSALEYYGQNDYSTPSKDTLLPIGDEPGNYVNNGLIEENTIIIEIRNGVAYEASSNSRLKDMKTLPWHLLHGHLSRQQYTEKEKLNAVSTAHSLLGTADYNWYSKNCEHFVNECLIGQSLSYQSPKLVGLSFQREMRQ